VAVVTVVAVDKLEVGDMMAVIVENEPLTAELDAAALAGDGTELDAAALPGKDTAEGEPAVIVENEPLIAELVAGIELGTGAEVDVAVPPEDDTADDELVVDPGGGPVPARMRIPTLMVLAALEISFCADRR
jgi:hypothetical protein